MCLCLSFLVEVQRPAAFQSGQCSSHAAFLVGRAAPSRLFAWAAQLFDAFRGNRPTTVPGGWTSPPLCELRTTSRISQFLDLSNDQCNRITGASRLYGNSCAQLSLVTFVLREEFAFCFRPFPELTLLDRRRRRGAIMSFFLRLR